MLNSTINPFFFFFLFPSKAVFPINEIENTFQKSIFPSGLFIMRLNYSVVHLVLPLWSLMPKYLVVVGQPEPV